MEPCRRPREGGALSWGYFNLRDFYRRLYEAVKASHPDVQITIHTHGQPRAIGAFVDYVFIGEALNVVFRGDRPLREIRERPDLYKPNYMDLPVGFLEAQIFPRVGGATALLPEVHLGRDRKNPQREIQLTREMFAEVLVNDIPVWLTNSDVRTRTAIMESVDRFGNRDEATFHPWWTDPLGLDGKPDIVASAYTRDGTALFVISNRGSSPASVVLKPDLERLGLAPGRPVDDAEQPASHPMKLQESGIPIEVAPHDFRLVWVR